MSGKQPERSNIYLLDPSAKPVTMELLSVEQVSSLTGLSVETLAQWRSRKKHIEYLKIGRLIRYTRRDIEAYLERCRVSVSEGRQK